MSSCTTDDVIGCQVINDDRVGVVPLMSPEQMQDLLPIVTIVVCPTSLRHRGLVTTPDDRGRGERELTFAL